MTTYLEICQEVALQSGTVPTIGQPATTTGATGRLQRIIGWSGQAYKDIQRLSTHWRWMSAEFSGQTIAGVSEYDAAAMGVTERFRAWQTQNHQGNDLFTLYKTSEGIGTEGHLSLEEWEWMRRNAFIGDFATNTDKPYYITITPDDKLKLYPTPDDVYTIRGRYHKSPQILTADADVLEMPSLHDEAVTWKALLRMAIFDEAFDNIPGYERMYMNALNDLKKDQLPEMKMGGPLA